jgi:hypothetical protein
MLPVVIIIITVIDQLAAAAIDRPGLQGDSPTQKFSFLSSIVSKVVKTSSTRCTFSAVNLL